MKEKTSQARFTFNTIGLFTSNNKATVDFYTKTFGFTTSWDGVQPNVEMFLGDYRIILYPRDAFEQMVSKKFWYPEGVKAASEQEQSQACLSSAERERAYALSRYFQSHMFMLVPAL